MYIYIFFNFLPLIVDFPQCVKKTVDFITGALSSGKNNRHLKQERFVKCSLQIKYVVEQKYTELIWEHVIRSREDLNMGIFISL